MCASNVVLMLIYEPASTEAGPIAIARIADGALIVAAAEAAVFQAEARAVEIASLGEVLGRIEELEARRLRALLALLVPGFQSYTTSSSGKCPVM
jgi:hypothetical protein